MSDDAGRTFLSRWSRRKIEARAAEKAQADENALPPAAPLPGAAVAAGNVAAGNVAADSTDPPAQAAAPEEQLPDPETLRGLESDYRGFLRPEVDESLRRTALKKLFADPHFNVMDGLDVYIDDYSKPDPIPPALLRTMNQARGLRLFDDEEDGAAAKAADVAEADHVALQQSPSDGEGQSLPAQEGQVAAASTDCPSTPQPSPAGASSPFDDGNKG